MATRKGGGILSLDWMQPTMQLLLNLASGHIQDADHSKEEALENVIQETLDHIWSIIQVPGCARSAPLSLAHSVFMPRKGASGALDSCKGERERASGIGVQGGHALKHLYVWRRA